MKDKERVTLMVCTSADGWRAPLALIGKSKKPVCFQLLTNSSKPPIAYRNQRNAWFDKDTTEWWIHNVFWPAHLKRHGHVNCILLLDNFSGHNVDISKFSPRLTILFLPPNVTCKHQPADMGMIASLKVGYKSLYLKNLLEIFDNEGGYEEAARLRKQQKRGMKGILFGGKPHILDCMQML